MLIRSSEKDKLYKRGCLRKEVMSSMTEYKTYMENNIMFKGTDIKPFPSKVWLASPTMHGEELKYITVAYKTN